MSASHLTLPPLATLNAFESAARHLSFKNAAEELQITPSAVSQHIKSLEQTLGCTLFNRRHRAVALTEQGEHLHQVLDESLSRVAQVLDEIRSNEHRKPVTVSATTAVSSLWLTPRLTEFWKQHGDIAVNQYVSDLPPRRGVTFDLKIWYGVAPAGDDRYRLLFRDQLVPVCSPRFSARGPIDSLQALAAQPLIHLDASADWTDWHRFFTDSGYSGPINRGPQVNNYTIAVQSARVDVGVLLGWKSLLGPLLDRGALVSLEPFCRAAPGRFYLVSAQPHRLRKTASVLRDWLINSS